MTEPTPEAWVQIRHDYEHTDRPIVDICAEHGITDPMLRYRVKRWKWQKRRSLIPRQGPPPVPAMQQQMAAPPAPYAEPVHPTPPAFADASAGGPPPPGEGVSTHAVGQSDTESAAIVPRLQSAVVRVLPAIEATIARLTTEPHHPREMEQAGRALGALTRTLRELNALLSQHEAGGRAAGNDNDVDNYDDDMPEDIHAFRHDLARRIDAFVASRMAENDTPPDALSGAGS